MIPSCITIGNAMPDESEENHLLLVMEEVGEMQSLFYNRFTAKTLLPLVTPDLLLFLFHVLQRHEHPL